MSYSLLPCYYTTTNTRKHKKRKRTKSERKADAEHEKFLKKMGITNIRSVAQSGSASALGAEGQGFKSSHSDQHLPPLSNNIPVGVTPKRKVYTDHNFTIAPAYNKGAYQVISKQNVKDIGR